MYALQVESRLDGRCLHHAVTGGEGPLPFRQAMEALVDSAAFRELLLDALSGAAFTAFRWETPPVTTATAGRPFEFVLMDAPELDRPPETSAFRERFTDAAVVDFRNLGGDALLVVPCPRADAGAYVHLASFVRRAPAAQVHAFLQAVGEAVLDRLGADPLWLSTAGDGVAWLHVRLDSRPKYYTYLPYTTA